MSIAVAISAAASADAASASPVHDLLWADRAIRTTLRRGVEIAMTVTTVTRVGKTAR